MTVLQAHFDGKVFVPDSPPNLQPGSVVLQIIEVGMDAHPLTGMPVLRVPPGAKTITSDGLRRAIDGDE
jgi:hypothetical protein